MSKQLMIEKNSPRVKFAHGISVLDKIMISIRLDCANLLAML